MSLADAFLKSMGINPDDMTKVFNGVIHAINEINAKLSMINEKQDAILKVLNNETDKQIERDI